MVFKLEYLGNKIIKRDVKFKIIRINKTAIIQTFMNELIKVLS